VKILGNEINSITWFNGLVLGKAKSLKIDGLGLFRKIAYTDTSQFQAARNVIKKLKN